MPLATEYFRLQSLERFIRAGIWDAFYWGSWQEREPLVRLDEALTAEREFMIRAGILRQCIHLHVGTGTARDEHETRIRSNGGEIKEALVRHADRLLGVARLNGDDVSATLAAIDKWITRGPMIGVCLLDGGVPWTQANFDPIVQRAGEQNALIVQLNWYNQLERKNPNATTPAHLAELAARHPNVMFISGHAGGDWENGIRAVRSRRNILVETSGFDPTAGFIEMAVRELGADRIVFGSHFPSRSMGTEFSKVLSADITDREKELIFSGNLRRLLAPILRRKGLPAGG
jgi:predicted TIM-barrel fold metal-dependent hydrolase